MKAVVAIALSIGTLTFGPAALAHHSFAAEFDVTKPVTLRGTVTKVEWRNPHVWVYLDVTDERGSVTAWQCEGGAPNALTRLGWSRETLKLGDPVTIEGYLAKDATNTCNARTWKLPNGQSIFAGQADTGAPSK
jgi:hypothetical protein